MGYIETLEVGGREIGNPGFRNTSVEVFLARQEAGIRNRHFLNALWRSYPNKKPKHLREKPLAGRITKSIPDRTEQKEKSERDLSGSALFSAAAYHDGIKAGKPISKAIVAAVANWFDLEPTLLTGKSRIGYVVSARFVAMRLLYDMRYESTGAKRYSYPMIGSFFGGRDHSTVIHAIKTFDDRARAYPEMLEAYEALKDAA